MADPRVALFPYECRLPFCEELYRYVSGGFHPEHFGDMLHDRRYRILHKLGYGSFSTVWAARDEQEQRYVAIKIPEANAPSSLETNILTTLTASKSKQPGMAYIPKLLDEFDLVGPNGTHTCTVTDVFGAPVGKCLDNGGDLLIASAARRLQRQVLEAVECLYQHDIVHGDVYTGNIAWKARGLNEFTEEEFLRLFPYALTKEVKSKDGSPLPPNVPKYLVMHGYNPTQSWNEDDIMLIDFGQAFYLASPPATLATPICYRPPEVVFHEKVDEKVDVWSAGILCFVFLTSSLPVESIIWKEYELIDSLQRLVYHHPPARWQKEWQIMVAKANDPYSEDFESFQARIEAHFKEDDNGKLQDLPTEVFRRAGELFEKVLQLDPKDRISAKQALELDWFKDPS
ncbi:kinase-like protein [Piedraia hortae CBS 480.64]|uniref:Kinase-like protein n=1 Tax=Piedraia hortae CBS 480.64 TaxID=1314780 RepID=A0A6A7BYL7_9PEZI|nr:kinase-like protein [Piedraia hortae CBS 480.64]